MPRLWLDKEGKPFCKVDPPKIRYQITEKVRAKGKIMGTRQVTKQIEKPTIKDYDIKGHGWFKTLTWRVLAEIKGHKARGSILVPNTALFVMTYRFNANKLKPCLCGNSQLYIRVMPTGIHRTCANCGITSGSLATDDKYGDSGIKKVDEQEVSRRQAIDLFEKGQIHYMPIFLRKRFGLPTM